MMHDKAMRAFCALSLGLVFGGFAACAGTDVPPTDDLEDDIATAYANGAGVSGGTGGSASTGGSGGRASAAGNGGAAGDDGDDPGPAGGAGGTGGGAGGSGGEPDEEPDPSGACDGFAVLETNCAGGSCHGAGSGLGNFAESEEDALSFVDADASVSCSGEGALINPADPGASVIIQKVDGTPPCGQAMPIGGTLTDDEISCLEEWIGSL